MKATSQVKDYYVHATDGQGMYFGMKVLPAVSVEDAIAQAKATWKGIPEECSRWFATTDKAYIKSARR